MKKKLTSIKVHSKKKHNAASKKKSSRAGNRGKKQSSAMALAVRERDGLGPGKLWGPAKAMVKFGRPLFDAASASNEDMQQASHFASQLWNAFLPNNSSQRDLIIESLRSVAHGYSWMKISFDACIDLLFRRHIYFFEDIHEGESYGFPKQALREAAMYGEEASLPAPGKFPLPDSDILDETSALVDYDLPYNRLDDFLDRIVPVLESYREEKQSELVLEYQMCCTEVHETILNHFAAYMEGMGMDPDDIDSHMNNITAYLQHFLVQDQVTYIDEARVDDLEEFILGYYVRQVSSTRNEEVLLNASLANFYGFVLAVGILPSSELFWDKLEACRKEFIKLMIVQRCYLRED